MLKSMIKQREGLLAKLVAAIFLVGALAGFVSPEAALAAGHSQESEYVMPDGTVGTNYDRNFFCSHNGVDDTNEKISDLRVEGDLPEGLNLKILHRDPVGDYFKVEGTPVKEGEYKFSLIFLSVSDQLPEVTNTRWNWTMKVNPSQDPYIVTKSIKGTVSENLSAKLEAKNFDGDVTWSLQEGSSEKLKDYGLSFDNGTISGTPVKEGTFDIGVMAKGKKNGEDAAKDGTVTIKIGTKSDDKDHDDHDDDDDDDHHDPVNWSTDSLTVRYFVDGHYATNLKSGKIQQGNAAKAIFTASKPAGWTEAFSFNLSFDDKTDYTLKNGILTLYISSDYIKAGRQYALMGMDQGGQVHIYSDTDAQLGTVTTVPLNLQGYAMELIYKD